jgi:hypothetical protein
MTPYYFSASFSQSINVWMLSYAFTPKVGLAFSGSVTKLAEGSGNAWQFSSSFSGAAFHYIAPSSSVYKIENTSFSTGKTGSFELRVSEAETSSIFTGQAADSNTPARLVYSPKAGRIFAIEQVFITSSLSAKAVVVINPQSNVVENTFGFVSKIVMDGVYNSVDDTVWVWISGSAGEFLNEYNSSGSSLIASHSISTDWNNALGNQFGYMSYNKDNNQILLVPRGSGATPTLSYSIYSCNSHTTLHKELMPYVGIFSTYVSSSNKFYVAPNVYGNAVVKIDPVSFTHSLSSITNSAQCVTYIPELDIIVGGGDAGFNNGLAGPLRIYNPTNDVNTNTVPGIFDAESPVVYDQCNNCLVVADDAAGDPVNFTGGGLCYINTSSYSPINFISLPGSFAIIYCNSTSTVWAGTYNDDKLFAIITSRPTASLPQPS